MSFPFLFEENWNLGTIGTWNSETDTETRLSVDHFSDLAAIPGLPAPWRGAYAMRVNLANDGSPADAYVQEDDGFDAAADATLHIRFMLWVSPDITMANNDEFIVLALQSAGPVDEAVIVINYTTANGLRIGVGETSGSQFLPLSTGRWHAVELHAEIDAGVGNDGSLILRLDGAAATTVSSLDQGAIIQARLGVMGQDAGTTKGQILFNQVMVDDARIFMPENRWQSDVLLTKSGHVFVGPGEIANVTLLSGAGTDNVLQVWDTDVAYTSDASDMRLELKNTANNEVVDPAGVPICLNRGCYVALSGTNPRAMVKVCRAAAWGSDGAVRSYGLRRLPKKPAA